MGDYTPIPFEHWLIENEKDFADFADNYRAAWAAYEKQMASDRKKWARCPGSRKGPAPEEKAA